MKKDCKPCITISTIWKLTRLHYNNLLKDIRAFNTVQEYSCKIHYDETVLDKVLNSGFKTLERIRKYAAENYSKQKELDQQILTEISENLGIK
jgi:hypothetical protein